MSRWYIRSHKQPVVYPPPPGPPPSSYTPSASLPQWTAAAEPSHAWGLNNEAPESEYEAAELFCKQHPMQPPRFIESRLVDQIRDERAAAWQLEVPASTRFKGSIKNTRGQIHISTHPYCQDTSLLSNLPIIAGHYTRQGQSGAYYEITVDRMESDAVIALGFLGSVCRPYPEWRLPGWNRLSAGLHLDDMRKFFEDPDGGRDYTGAHGYLQALQNGDTFGFGYEFATGNIFFTRNGGKLPNAFLGAYLPAKHGDPGYDVYAAVGVSGRTEVGVNFGTEPFMWKEANTPPWRVECHVGRLGGSSGVEDELPAYAAIS